jgi:hypothetical protein
MGMRAFPAHKRRRFMKRPLRFGVASIALLSSLSVSAVVIRHDKDDKLYKDFAKDARFASVGRFDFSSDSSSGYGTANYIGKNSKGEKWILTAAHVVESSMSKASFTIGGTEYKVDIPSIKYISNYESGKWDIGVAKLLDPDDTLKVKPARYSNITFPVNSDLTKRQKAYAAGFGRTGNGNTGATTEDKTTMRGMINVLDALGTTRSNGNTTYAGYMSDFDKNDATNNKLDRTDFAAANWQAGQKSSREWLDLEGQLATGDSGGGLFTDFNGDYLMIGIASAARALDQSSTTTYGAFTQWSALDKTMADRVEGWTGIAGVPEPGTLVVLGIALGAIARRKKRS